MINYQHWRKFSVLTVFARGGMIHINPT